MRLSDLSTFGPGKDARGRLTDATTHAAAWTRDLAERLLEPLMDETRRILLDARWIATAPDPVVAAAALVSWIAAQYGSGHTPDELVDRLIESMAEDDWGLDRTAARHVVLCVAMTVRASPALPDPRWWDLIPRAEHIAVEAARNERVAHRDVVDLVDRRLWMTGAMRDAVLAGSQSEGGLDYAAVRVGPGAFIDEMQRLVSSGAAAALRDDLRAADEDVAGREDLRLARVQMEQLRAVRALAKSGGGDDLRAFVEAEANRFVEAVSRLSLLERGILRPPSEDERVLMRLAAIMKPIVVISPGEGPTPLADLIDGERVLPARLDRYFGVSGETYQSRAGAITSWCVVFDGPLPDGLGGESFKFGVGLTEGEDGPEFLLRFAVAGDDVAAPISYPKQAVASKLNLAVLALTGEVRLDFFARDRARAFRHVHQSAFMIEGDLRDRLVERAAALARDLLAAGEDAAWRAIAAELGGEDPLEQAMAGFLMCEHGRAEALLEASVPSAALGPYFVATAEQERRLKAARHDLLEAEARRVEGHGSAESADEAVSAYVGVIQDVRGSSPQARPPSPERELEELGGEVVTRHRAFVHLAIGTTGLVGFWLYQDGHNPRTEAQSLNDVDLGDLRVALEDPCWGTIDLVDRPGHAGRRLGQLLADKCEQLALDDLVVCATRFLHPIADPCAGCGRRRAPVA